MPPDAVASDVRRSATPRISRRHAASRSRRCLQRLVTSQPFWVTVALLVLVVVDGALRAELRHGRQRRQRHPQLRAVRHHGAGHDRASSSPAASTCRSARSWGWSPSSPGLFLTWDYPWYVAFAMGLLTGLACGAVNGFFVAYVGMPSFVVTLGMLSIARSLAVVFSGNQMLYKFGPDAPIVKAIGQAKWPLQRAGRLGAALDPGVLVAFLGHDRAGADRRLRLQLQAPGRAISLPSAATSRPRG